MYSLVSTAVIVRWTCYTCSTGKLKRASSLPRGDLAQTANKPPVFSVPKPGGIPLHGFMASVGLLLVNNGASSSVLSFHTLPARDTLSASRGALLTRTDSFDLPAPSDSSRSTSPVKRRTVKWSRKTLTVRRLLPVTPPMPCRRPTNVLGCFNGAQMALACRSQRVLFLSL